MTNKEFHKVVKYAADLVTKSEKTVEGFILQAKEKTVRAKDLVKQARRIEKLLQVCKNANEIITNSELKSVVLACAGLSAKAQGHLTDQQLKEIAKATLEEITQSGTDLVTEVLYRYLLTTGDSLGGSMRNWTGASAQRLVADIIQQRLKERGQKVRIIVSKDGKFQLIEWKNRTLVFDKKPKMIGKNIDMILLRGNLGDSNLADLTNAVEKYVAIGELKGGIDPAGADEHWKTASKALTRVRKFFSKGASSPKLFFAAAAIESSMADEIFKEVNEGSLEFAANLTSPRQTLALIDWLISL